MSTPDLTKGMRVRAQWMQVYTHPYSLAGAQIKVHAQAREVTGVVKHIRTNAPVDWTQRSRLDSARRWGEEIELDIACVVGILS